MTEPRAEAIRRRVLRAQDLGAVTLGVLAVAFGLLADGSSRWVGLVLGPLLIGSPWIMARVRRWDAARAERSNPQHEAGY